MATTVDDNMLSPEVLTDPYTYFGTLRETEPVHWNDAFKMWIVTRYDDSVWIVRRHEVFSNAVWVNASDDPYPPIYESDKNIYRFIRGVFGDWLTFRDRPSHYDIRRILQQYFTPRYMEKWRSLIRSTVHELIDDLQDADSMDLVRDFAAPLPTLMIAKMMEMDHEDRGFIKDLAIKLTFFGRPEPDRMQTIYNAIDELIQYVEPMVEERLSEPGEDLITLLASGEKKGIMERKEVLANVLLLLLAGHDTTINLLANGTVELLRHPEEMEKLRENPELRVTATEECLRYEPPVKTVQRVAMQDVTVGDKLIREGDLIRWSPSSANRDPEHFDDPERFDISRNPNHHLTFSAGIHHCLGAFMARYEGQEAFSALAERLPNLELVDDKIEYEPTITNRSPMSVPVRWA